MLFVFNVDSNICNSSQEQPRKNKQIDDTKIFNLVILNPQSIPATNHVKI